jgi:hypothetical protein
VIVRRLLPALAAAVLLTGAARPVEAAPRARLCRPIKAITLMPEGAGTLIRITYGGHARVVTRVIRSAEPLDALAVADVDNDGDLDIVAAREGGGLVVWHNAGHGRFVFAVAAARHGLSRRETAVREVVDTTAPAQSSDERCSAAMARAPDALIDPVEIPHLARASSILLSAFSACSQGRAPPSPIV